MKRKTKNRHSQETQELIRFRVADYLKSKIGTQKQCAEIFGLTQTAVNKIWSRYKVGGEKALKSKKRGVQQGKKLKKEHPKKKGTIYFGDETGCKSTHQAGRSYAPKGQTPIIKATVKRFTVNMISAISNRGHLQFMLMEAGLNSEVFKIFLEQIIKYSRRKVFFITDNHPSHKTKKLNQWLRENKDKMEVLFIPPYSLELNPQEYVNQDLKTNIIGKKRAINKEQLKQNINDFMNKRKADKPQVKKYFHHRHAKYAA